MLGIEKTKLREIILFLSTVFEIVRKDRDRLGGGGGGSCLIYSAFATQSALRL